MNKLIPIMLSTCFLISQSFATSVQTSKSETYVKDRGSDKDDESSAQEKNLQNIAVPHVVNNNISNNLQRIDNNDRLLNKQMMLDGPQGGIQSNKPRGI
jgi:hypothetical protein